MSSCILECNWQGTAHFLEEFGIEINYDEAIVLSKEGRFSCTLPHSLSYLDVLETEVNGEINGHKFKVFGNPSYDEPKYKGWLEDGDAGSKETKLENGDAEKLFKKYVVPAYLSSFRPEETTEILSALEMVIKERNKIEEEKNGRLAKKMEEFRKDNPPLDSHDPEAKERYQKIISKLL